MGDAYPRLAEQQAHITSVLKAEEERFFETLAHGMEILDGALRLATVKPLRRQNAARRVAFKLHDTYGFPLDLTNDVCRERGVTVDEAGFDAAMQHQKDTARAAGKFKMDRALDYEGAATTFTATSTWQKLQNRSALRRRRTG
jgi:alanyl-tRNA synthetase